MTEPKHAKRSKKVPRINHRTVVGRRRRAKTEEKIIRSALAVFARKGTHAVIDDFIKAAGIARGTFYIYFRSTEQLLEAVRLLLTDEHNRVVEEALVGIDDPITRLGTGIRLWMWRAEHDHAWAGFVARVRLHGTKSLEAPMNDLRHAKRLGQVNVPSPLAAMHLMEGAGTSALHGFLAGRPVKGYGDAMTTVILQGLGVDADTIRTILSRPLPKMKALPRHEELPD
ncbi:MAG: helix-turn-helix domain-containing protein [Steroidobacteraceae bacterium]